MQKKSIFQGFMITTIGFFVISCAGGEGSEETQSSSSTTPTEELTTVTSSSVSDYLSAPEEMDTLASDFLPTMNFALSDSSIFRTSERGRGEGPGGRPGESTEGGPEEARGEGTEGSPEEARGEGPRGSKSLIGRWGSRIDRISNRIERLLSKLNSQEVDETGAFTESDSERNISGKIVELSGDSTYQNEALICHNDTPFLQVKWSTDESQVETIRDYSDTDSNSFTTQVLYTQSDTTTIEVISHGTPRHKPDDITEDQMTHYMYSHKASDGTITFNGVQDWYSTVPASFTGDGYLVGKIDTDDSGEHVAYSEFREECADTTFDEDAVSGSSWCLGKAHDSDTSYTADELSEAWDRLEDVGIAKQSNLKVIAMDTTLTCP